MSLLRCLLVPCLSFFVFGCAVNAPPIKEHAAIEVPDGKNTKSMSLRGIRSKLSKGAIIGSIGEGWGCMKMRNLEWRAGRVNVADEDIQSAFIEELKRNNYNVLGDPGNLFEDKSTGADLAVGGLITNIKWEVCYHNGYLDNWSKGSTYVEIDIEWQVYDALDRKTIYKHKTTGQGKAEFDNRNADAGFLAAVVHATQGLLADKNFYNIVLDKNSDDNPSMGGLTDMQPNVPANKPAGSSRSGAAPVSAKVSSVADAQHRVVIVQMGGGHGSGFLVGNTGYILTNHHVVDDAKKVRVTYSNGVKAEGRVLSSDPRQDVALVQVDAPPLGGLPIRHGDVPVGTDVYAIGAPKDMALQGTVSKGVVSSYRSNKRGRWLQSDTTVNQGNSGGPLVDAQGRVVGITSWGFTGENSKGLNFFVPIDDALRVMNISAN